MEIPIFYTEGEGPRRTWWIGEGKWWLMIEGFGLVYVG